MDAYECVDGWLGILADVCTGCSAQVFMQNKP